jgi:hypothetical protein
MLCFARSRCVTLPADSMKMIFASILTTILIVAMTLGAMFALLRATIYVTAIDSPLERAGAIVAELLLGVVLLLGTVWMATHLAVRIFSSSVTGVDDSTNNGLQAPAGAAAKEER